MRNVGWMALRDETTGKNWRPSVQYYATPVRFLLHIIEVFLDQSGYQFFKKDA